MVEIENEHLPILTAVMYSDKTVSKGFPCPWRVERIEAGSHWLLIGYKDIDDLTFDKTLYNQIVTAHGLTDGIEPHSVSISAQSCTQWHL